MSINTYPTSELDFKIKVAAGQVPGVTSIINLGYSELITTDRVDLWDTATILDYPTANEIWEVLSASGDDDSTGTGAQAVVLTYLDSDKEIQTSLVIMDGTNPVEVATDCYRVRSFAVVSSGSGGINAGNITLRQKTSDKQRGFITAGFGVDNHSHYTVPAGFTAYPVGFFVIVGKDASFEIRLMIRFPGTNTYSVINSLTAYQNASDYQYPTTLPIPAGTDVKIMAKTGTGTSTLKVIDNLFEVAI